MQYLLINPETATIQKITIDHNDIINALSMEPWYKVEEVEYTRVTEKTYMHMNTNGPHDALAFYKEYGSTVPAFMWDEHIIFGKAIITGGISQSGKPTKTKKTPKDIIHRVRWITRETK